MNKTLTVIGAACFALCAATASAQTTMQHDAMGMGHAASSPMGMGKAMAKSGDAMKHDAMNKGEMMKKDTMGHSPMGHSPMGDKGTP